MKRRLPLWLLAVPAIPVVLFFVARLLKRRYPLPMPVWAANLSDPPIRGLIHPPAKMPAWLGLASGMDVLEIGPGNGHYTCAAARWVGSEGTVTAADVQPRMLTLVKAREEREGVTNISTRLADAMALPFAVGTFDAAYMIAVLGEVPDELTALRECHRVLRPGGTLALCEMLPDPDFITTRRAVRLARLAGFRVLSRRGLGISYILLLEKPA